MRRSTATFVLTGLGIALLAGMFFANFATRTPDALQRAVIDSACQDAVDKEACLAEKEGDPVLLLAPEALLDYGNVPLSGLVGVVATFAVGSALIYLLRLSRRPRRGSARGDLPYDAGSGD